jgi:hypothetical protein
VVLVAAVTFKVALLVFRVMAQRGAPLVIASYCSNGDVNPQYRCAALVSTSSVPQNTFKTVGQITVVAPHIIADCAINKTHIPVFNRPALPR